MSFIPSARSGAPRRRRSPFLEDLHRVLRRRRRRLHVAGDDDRHRVKARIAVRRGKDPRRPASAPRRMIPASLLHLARQRLAKRLAPLERPPGHGPRPRVSRRMRTHLPSGVRAAAAMPTTGRRSRWRATSFMRSSTPFGSRERGRSERRSIAFVSRAPSQPRKALPTRRVREWSDAPRIAVTC